MLNSTRQRKTKNCLFADRHIGTRVRMRRIMLRMSQEKLADALGLTFQQVQKYEKGTNRISGSRIMQIADALQVAPGYFFEGMASAESAADDGSDLVQQMLADRQGVALAKAYLAIKSRSMRSAIVAMTEAAMEKALAEEKS